jgi:hypothetical protein
MMPSAKNVGKQIVSDHVQVKSTHTCRCHVLRAERVFRTLTESPLQSRRSAQWVVLEAVSAEVVGAPD